MNILEFADAHRYPLFPVQRVLLKLIYRLPLTDAPIEVRTDWRTDLFEVFTERQYVQRLADAGQYRDGGGRIVVASLGRRAGKDHLLVLMAAFEAYKLAGERVSERFKVPRSATLGITVVGLNTEMCHQYMTRVTALAETSLVSGYLANQTQAFLRFQTAEDIEDTGTWRGSQRQARASIKLQSRSAMAKGLRGYTHAFLAFNELSLFPSDTEVWDACVPATATLSATSVAFSTPRKGRSKFRDAYNQTGALAVRIPTWEMNPTYESKLLVQQYENYGPALFQQEFGASFTDDIEIDIEDSLYEVAVGLAKKRGIPVERLIYECLVEAVRRQK